MAPPQSDPPPTAPSSAPIPAIAPSTALPSPFPLKDDMESAVANLGALLFHQGWRNFTDIMLHIGFAVGTSSFPELISWRKVALRKLTSEERRQLRAVAVEWDEAPVNVEEFLRTRRGLGVVDMGAYRTKRVEGLTAKTNNGKGKAKDVSAEAVEGESKGKGKDNAKAEDVPAEDVPAEAVQERSEGKGKEKA